MGVKPCREDCSAGESTAFTRAPFDLAEITDVAAVIAEPLCVDGVSVALLVATHRTASLVS
jgi:hypothetical protein